MKLDNQKLLFEVADSLTRLVIREHQILQDELNQVGVLVEDAVKSLNVNLRALNTHAKKSTQSDIEQLSDAITSNTSEMIRALQFDDIVQQLSKHAGNRIRQMQELFSSLDEKVSEIKSSEVQVVTTLKNLESMLDVINEYRQSLEKNNPVKQNSMSAGNVELF